VFEIVPIRQVDVYREVLAQLEGLVRTMPAGARLAPERELAEQLKVSRVSVREALRALESMGKVEIRRNTGAFVLDPDGAPPLGHLRQGLQVDAAFLQWLTEARAAIEVKVVELVAGSAADLSAARAVLERAGDEARGHLGSQGSLDLRFEAALGRIAGNPLLTRMQSMVHQLWVEAWSEAGLAPGEYATFHAEHEQILAALEAGDGSLAVRRMAEHVDRRVRALPQAERAGV
jgi:GntR family transcriptional repressor for pyruvate dehydrogenase complex